MEVASKVYSVPVPKWCEVAWMYVVYNWGEGKV
jgi:hypothetical protein